MCDPFCDDADFELASLPPPVTQLLISINAPLRLIAHLRLVHDVAIRLTVALSEEWLSLQLDSEAVHFGAATHDIGKVLFPDELVGPGHNHEIEGRKLLGMNGFEDRLARFAETHAAWDRDDDHALEDLLVGLADTAWKGKRSELLEDLICDQILKQSSENRWAVFAKLDSIVQQIVDLGDQRLAWQSRY